jgi:hypothetical protein
MAKLSKPEDMDNMGESDGSNDQEAAPAVPAEPEIPEVDFAGEGKIPITDAVESLSKITQHPEAFEVGSHEQIVELQNENYELRKELAQLREDMAVLWEALATKHEGKHAVQTESGGYVPESFDEKRPIESAKESGPNA